MAQTATLTAQPRTGIGSRASEKLRKAGQIPAIVYGHGEQNATVSLVAEDFYKVLKQGAKLYELKADGKSETVRIVALDYDHLGKEILHVDFQRTDASEQVTAHVKVELKGVAPGTSGEGVLDQPLHVLTIRCAADSVPDSIRVDINSLQLNQMIHVKELKLPQGVQVVEDGDLVVVRVTLPGAEMATEAAPDTDTVQEVITKGKVEKEEEGK